MSASLKIYSIATEEDNQRQKVLVHKVTSGTLLGCELRGFIYTGLLQGHHNYT